MKPRNRKEREVMELYKKLPPISEKQKKWAEEHCHEGIGYKNKELVWCTKCGCEFYDMPDLGMDIGDKTVCPMCGEKLTVKTSTKRKIDEEYYYTIVTTAGGWQVLRHYSVGKWMRRITKYIHDCQQPKFYIREIVQEWIDCEGRKVIVARPRLGLMCGMIAFDFNRPMEVRREFNGYSYQPSPYNIHAFTVYPWKRVIPILKRNGLKGRWPDICPSDLMVKILTDSRAETLLKTGQEELLKYLVKRGGMIYWRQAMIAIRNGYVVKDADLWIDMLTTLEILGKDLHNAKYICPENLREAHDRYVKMRRKRDEKRDAERKRKDALYWEGRYKEEKGRFFGIKIVEGRIVIEPIRSVREMQEEGDEMHHCVATNEYYKKGNSLILSAKDEDGNRIETIEVSLKTMKVVQCFGKFNKTTEQHSEILDMMNRNMNKIVQCYEKSNQE